MHLHSKDGYVNESFSISSSLLPFFSSKFGKLIFGSPLNQKSHPSYFPLPFSIIPQITPTKQTLNEIKSTYGHLNLHLISHAKFHNILECQLVIGF